MAMVTDRQRRWLSAVLVLGTFVLAIVLLNLVGSIFFAFGDVVLVFFLAWLLAFILSPLVSGLTRLVPFLPRIGAVVLVYALLVGAIVLAVVLVAGALASSISDFVASVPTLRHDLPRLLAPWQARSMASGSARSISSPRRRASSTTSPTTRSPSPGRSSSWRSPASGRSATCSSF